MKRNSTLAGLVLCAFTLPSTASTVIDNRGYQNCEAQMTSEFESNGLMLSRNYHVRRTDESRVYYIEGSVWGDDGGRADVRVTCETSRNGREILGLVEGDGEKMKESGLVAR